LLPVLTACICDADRSLGRQVGGANATCRLPDNDAATPRANAQSERGEFTALVRALRELGSPGSVEADELFRNHEPLSIRWTNHSRTPAPRSGVRVCPYAAGKGRAGSASRGSPRAAKIVISSRSAEQRTRRVVNVDQTCDVDLRSCLHPAPGRLLLLPRGQLQGWSAKRQCRPGRQARKRTSSR